MRRDVAEGKVQIIASALTSEGQAQLCGTGLLDWSAERVQRASFPIRHVEGLVRLRQM